MKKFIAILTLVISVNANAGLLTIDISADEVSIGEPVLVTINAENFDETDMFWFDVNFDNAVIAYDAGSLNSDLMLIDNDPMLNGLEISAENNGLAANFFTDDFSLMADGNFVLASFNLFASSEGSTDLSVADLTVFDAFGITEPYTVAFLGASSINVNSNSIPLPNTTALLILAAFVLVHGRRKAQ